MLRRTLIACGLAGLTLFACSKDGEQSTQLPPADATYILRGRITGLPNPPKQFLRIHHEALPTFADEKGTVIGMEEMEMDFPSLAPGLSLSAFKPEDAIEATMEMRWKSQPRFIITAIKKLPEGATLHLGKILTEDDAPPKK